MKSPAFLCFALVVSLTGCAAESSPDAVSAGADLEAASVLPHGFYGLDTSREAKGFRWINLLNLHGDGSFEGSMGDSVSNLSGHQFNASGTYGVKTIAGKATLELTYVFVGPRPTVEHYVLGGSACAPELEFDNEDGTLDGAFALRPLPAPATIHMDANAPPRLEGTITHGAPFLVMYAANRDQCPVSQSDASVFMMGKAPGAPIGQNQVEGQFPTQPVNGAYRLLTVAPPAGATLSLWFGNVTAAPDGHETCMKWDSNFGANYSFDMR